MDSVRPGAAALICRRSFFSAAASAAGSRARYPSMSFGDVDLAGCFIAETLCAGLLLRRSRLEPARDAGLVDVRRGADLQHPAGLTGALELLAGIGEDIG